MNVRPEGVFFVCKNLEVTPMNNTIPFHPAAHAPQITVDVNILSMLKQAASRLTEMASENVYLAAIGPDMELTIIVEEDASFRWNYSFCFYCIRRYSLDFPSFGRTCYSK